MESRDFFFELTPDRVLDAVESSGLVCTGRCLALNSYENRVYEVELEIEGMPIERKRVVKFYRPGRWSKEQILEEHEFLADLLEAEIPAVAPVRFADGETLHRTQAGDLWYAIFPKVGGRTPDEFTEDQFLQLGRLLARMHNVGASKPAMHRIRLSAETYGRAALRLLFDGQWVTPHLRERFFTAGEEIIRAMEPALKAAAAFRIHGDCHMGNLIWGSAGPFFLDFDDMVMGPAVQDFWLLVPGRDAEGQQGMNILLEGYEQMRYFDRSELRLIEGLRALRYLHYSAWLAKRWEDPAFPRAFPNFNTDIYWEEKTRDLEEQALLLRDRL